MTCTLCPRRCGADRAAGERGVCGAAHTLPVSRVMLHPWEEPCFGRKAGAVFFSGCSLGCVYCQNRAISRPADGGLPGEIWDDGRLADTLLSLQDQGADCLDLVTPTHYGDRIRAVLRRIRPRLTVPVVWNTGGYETPEAIEACASLADVFLTDFKYGSPETAARYSDAPDYPQTAAEALRAMYRVTGDPVWENGRLLRGIVLRHLVLPGCRHDSIRALRLAAEAVPPSSVVHALMRQYTPDFAPPEMRELRRRVTSFEYESVLTEAQTLGFAGYGQGRESAYASYTPDFPSTDTP